MKFVKLFFSFVLVIAALGGLGFLIQKTQAADGQKHLERLAALQKINDLDVALNRAMTLNRASSLQLQSDNKSEIIASLGDAMDDIDSGDNSLRGLTQEIDASLDQFLATAGDKFVLAFDFDIRSSQIIQRLIRSADAVPLYTNQSKNLVEAGGSIDQLLSRLQTDAMAVIIATSPEERLLDGIQSQLVTLKASISPDQAELAQSVDQLEFAIKSVIADKRELVERLDEFFDAPTAQHLKDLNDIYTQWHESRVSEAAEYRQYLVAYAVVLLLILAWLGLRLRRSFIELDRANETLEAQVEERTRDLSDTLKELQNSQAQLIQSEKMASLGQMVAGVAHEINTPLGYARGNADIVKTSLVDVRAVTNQQSKALQMIANGADSEAAVAEALSMAIALDQDLATGELLDELDSLLADTDHGLEQIAELVASLKDFSRVDRSRDDVFDVNKGIESALKICQNHLKGNIQVKKVFGELPDIECSPSQLNQIFLNIITNAAQAIDVAGRDEGRIFIHTSALNEGVNIRILDNGCGMSEETMAHIFEPFFTTKPVGKGTGLGMSIIYRIIEDHGGSIDVKSIEGKGSEFSVWLPLKQPDVAAADDAVAAAA